MENVEINITPMSLKNGVMGLPIQCCRNWDASGSVDGIFQYAGHKSSITFSPKHKNKERGTAAAWQFTVNDSIQFNQLKEVRLHGKQQCKCIRLHKGVNIRAGQTGISLSGATCRN